MAVAYIFRPMKQFLICVSSAYFLCVLCLTQRTLLTPVAFTISAHHRQRSQTQVVSKSKAKGVLILLNL